MDYFSLKMRASQEEKDCTTGDIHEQHISGAERIVPSESIEATCLALVRRAMNHPKGDPDKINIKIERVAEKDIQILDALSVTRVDVDSWQEGLEKAFELIGNAAAGIRENLPELLRATYPMRGAMLYDIRTGKRLEPDLNRGVRATYMDAVGANDIAIGKDNCKNHFNEAIVLATKVANAPGIVAELCISDDPDYVTGYVASLKLGYVRIMKLKEKGSPDGGRIFLFDSSIASPEECIEFLQKKKVLVRCP